MIIKIKKINQKVIKKIKQIPKNLKKKNIFSSSKFLQNKIKINLQNKLKNKSLVKILKNNFSKKISFKFTINYAVHEIKTFLKRYILTAHLQNNLEQKLQDKLFVQKMKRNLDKHLKLKLKKYFLKKLKNIEFPNLPSKNVSFNFTLPNLLRFPDLLCFSVFNLSLEFINSDPFEFTRFHGKCYGYNFNSVLADFN